MPETTLQANNAKTQTKNNKSNFIESLRGQWADSLLSFDEFCELVKDKKIVDLSAGQYVNKYSLSDMEKKHKANVAELEEVINRKIEPEEMNSKIEEIENNYKTIIDELKMEITTLYKESLIKENIIKAGGNVDIIFALIKGHGDIDKIIYDEETDSLVGIDEILCAYKTDENTANLFLKSDDKKILNDTITTTAAAGNTNEFETELNKAKKYWGIGV